MSVKLKIFFGMGLLVVLLVGVGVVAATLSNRLTEIFTQYRGVSQINQLANSMSEDMFEASLASLAMRSTGDGAKFDEFRSHIEDVRAAQSELQNMVTDPDIQGLVLGLTPKIDDYENALLSATGLFADLNTVFLQIKTHGQTARKDLTEAMRLSKSGDDPEGAYATGLGVKHLLLGRLYFERFVTSSDQADLARSQEELGIAETLLQDEWQALGTQQNRLKQDVLGNLALFRTDMANAGVLIEQRNATFAQMYEIRPSMLADVDAIVEGLVARQVILGTQGGDATQNAKLIISMVSLAGVLLGLALAFFIGRSITQPILRITRNMTEMADGDLQVVIEGQDNKHEIGTMARALEVFRARTMEVQDLLKARENDKKARAEEQKLAEERNRIMEEERQNAKDREAAAAAEQRRFAAFATFREDLEALITAASNGDFSVRLTETLEDRELNNLAQIMNELLTLLHGSMEDLRVHMTKLATGQLTARMQGERKGAFKELQDSFNSTIDALYGTVSQISTSGGSVSNTASELESASVAMSKRAEANAASLEETSAAVEEISNSLESVVENSKKASASTIRARDNAENGRVVANATREAMTRMSDASNRIGKVVGVIEEISFQINLLALNAGVEAARAGESGRGFSVVASEVRALALRSQEAVSEINDVIGENLNSVETSVEQVQKSQDAMEEIISEVIVASGQISEIASAVEQQSSGLQEINRAIQSIDSSAQSDAASIEELTASSKTLSKEAKSLQDTLAHFEVEDSTRPDTELSRVG